MSKVMRRGLHILIISAITVIFGVLTVVGVSADLGDTFTVNTVDGCPITYIVTSEGEFPEVEVSDCSHDYKGAVTLPESVINHNNNMSYAVTSIGDDAFKGCFMLKNVTISESVTSIGEGAFSSCHGLESITIPTNLTNIGNSSFEYCYRLKSITIPDKVITIGDYAFKWCTDLESITIGDSVESIGKYAFNNCESLTSIEIPASVTTIGDYAFWVCGNLSEVYCCALEPPCVGSNVFDYCAADIKFYITYIAKDAYVDAGWPKDNLVEVVKSVKVVDGSGNPIESAKVMLYLKEYTPFALTGGYTNSEGIYICPVDIPLDTIDVKKSGYEPIFAKVFDNFEIVVVMFKC